MFNSNIKTISIALVTLIIGVVLFQNCQKSNSSQGTNKILTTKDSLLFGTESKDIFDCTPNGVAGSSWILSWSENGLSYYYSVVSPNSPAIQFVLMTFESKTTPPPENIGGGPSEIWKGEAFDVHLWTFPSPDAPFASITTKDGATNNCKKLP